MLLQKHSDQENWGRISLNPTFFKRKDMIVMTEYHKIALFKPNLIFNLLLSDGRQAISVHCAAPSTQLHVLQSSVKLSPF